MATNLQFVTITISAKYNKIMLITRFFVNGAEVCDKFIMEEILFCRESIFYDRSRKNIIRECNYHNFLTVLGL